MTGSPPDADDLWPLFLLTVQAGGMMQARSLMGGMDAVTGGIAQAFGGDKADSRSARHKLKRLAYPESD